MKIKRKHCFCSIDWTKLQKGDRIKVIGGNGPYTMVNEKKFYTGTPSGTYVVHSIGEDGIHGYRGISHFFIYMGDTKKSTAGFLVAHKIKKYIR